MIKESNSIINDYKDKESHTNKIEFGTTNRLFMIQQISLIKEITVEKDEGSERNLKLS